MGRLHQVFAVDGTGQVVEVVARRHRHAVGTGRLDRQQVAAHRTAQAHVLVEPVGRLAGRADDRVLVRAVCFGRDVFDVVVGAVERGADQLGHRGVDDQQLAPRGGRLVEQHARDEFAALADDRPAEFEMHLAVADPQMVVDDGEQRREVGARFRACRS